MPTASYVKVTAANEDLAEVINCGTDQWAICLASSAPAGKTFTAGVTDLATGGGDWKKRKQLDAYWFLDPQAHRQPPAIPPLEAAEAVAEVAAQQVDAPDTVADGIAELRRRLEAERIAWEAFYADMLERQRDALLTRRIQEKLIERGLIDMAALKAQQEQDEEDEAIVRLMMEM